MKKKNEARRTIVDRTLLRPKLVLSLIAVSTYVKSMNVAKFKVNRLYFIM